MHTVDLLEQALNAAEQMGYKVRHEWLGGSGGGGCEIKGQKWIFLDLALDPLDQLELVAQALRADEAAATLALPPPLSQLLRLRKSA